MSAEIACALCGEKSSRKQFEKKINDGTYTMVRCQKCGLEYINPQPSKVELRSFYANSFDYSYMLDYGESNVPTNDRRILALKKHTKRGKYLDIGCGAGLTLNSAKKFGFEPVGVELSREVAEYAQKKWGFKVYPGDFLDVKFKEKFDAISMFYVLEHVRDPNKYFSKIFTLLKPGGTLILVVPNINSLIARVTGSGWDWINPPKHLYYFSKETLSAFLKNNRFKVVEVKTQQEDAFNSLLVLFFAFLQKTGLWDTLNQRLFVKNDISSQGFQMFKFVRLITDILSLPLYPIELLLNKMGKGPELLVIAQKRV